MSKEKRQKVVCPKCGGRLVYDTLFQVSYISQIKPDGTISKRVRKEEVGPEEFAYVRCSECSDFCIGPDEYDYSADGHIILTLEQDEEA